MKQLTNILALFFLVVPLTAASMQQEEIKKATTIDELAKMYDVSSCKTCHEKIYHEWSKSLHAKSLVGTPRTMFTIETAISSGMMNEWPRSGIKKVEDIKIEHMLTCLKCHLPQINDATDAVAQQIANAALDLDEETLNKLNINCLVCHNTKALIHKWVDGEPEKSAIYGKKEGEHGDKAYSKLKKSPIINESILCGQCHGLGPNFDLAEPTQCATLYGSYLHAYVPSGGSETCQDCHIKKGGAGHTMPAYRDPLKAKNAVTVDVSTKGYYFLPKAGEFVPTAYVTVKMTNNAGHRIPDG